MTGSESGVPRSRFRVPGAGTPAPGVEVLDGRGRQDGKLGMADAELGTQHQEPATAPASDAARQRRLVLGITSASHGLEHFEKHMLSVLYPVLMAEMGFGYAELGVLAAARAMAESGTQGLYGFLAPFARRTRLLALGNVIVAVGAVLTALAGSFLGLMAARCLGALGASAQHPVTASLLARYFPFQRGSVLALNSSIAGAGGLLAPAIAGVLVAVVGWRPLFYASALLLLAMGLAFLLLRERSEASHGKKASTRARLAQGWASYARVLRNRNMLVITLVMTVGAAGRGAGVNVTFLGPHFVNDLGIAVATAGVLLSVVQFGGIGGPLLFGWLSDRLSRTGVLQASLLLSAVATLWLAFQGADLGVLFVGLAIYGVVTHSRLTLTQALVADTLDDADRDAAFSLYYFLGFISGPLWTIAAGLLMDSFGFGAGFSVIAGSYLAGALLMSLVEEPRRARTEE